MRTPRGVFTHGSPVFLTAGMKEYCSSETFDISCGPNEAIMMQSAVYGRMQPGRCISGTYSLSPRTHNTHSVLITHVTTFFAAMEACHRSI